MPTRKKHRPRPKPAEKPHWDKAKHTLWFRGVIVKRFRQPADNQQRLLDAFEEEGWPPQIDDPLPQDAINPKVRLHDTIKRLNHNQETHLLHFGGVRNGEGISWEPVAKK